MSAVEIYYSSDGRRHLFRLNKNGATLSDVTNARIVEKDIMEYINVGEGDSQKRVGEIIYHFIPAIFLIRPAKLEFEVYDPYGSDKMQPRAGRKGIGLHFELKVLKYLREKLGRGDVKVHHNTVRPYRVEMLNELGIKPNGASHTLDQHIEKYETRIAEIEARLKHG